MTKMNEGLDWKHHGLDRARFDALATLLHLRHGGQTEPPSRLDARSCDDVADEGVRDDGDSTKAQTLVDFNPDPLRMSFLDRLAELIADEKGGQKVTATLMTAGVEKVSVFIARNEGFCSREKEFFQYLETKLRRIASGSRECSPPFRDAIDQLRLTTWQEARKWRLGPRSGKQC